MDINALMYRIWSTIATPEGIKTEVQLSDDEWQLILEKWPNEYGNAGNIRKSTESVNQLREDWASRNCFYLYGREIRAKVAV